jgi:hypothetical protein
MESSLRRLESDPIPAEFTLMPPECVPVLLDSVPVPVESEPIPVEFVLKPLELAREPLESVLKLVESKPIPLECDRILFVSG